MKVHSRIAYLWLLAGLSGFLGEKVGGSDVSHSRNMWCGKDKSLERFYRSVYLSKTQVIKPRNTNLPT